MSKTIAIAGLGWLGRPLLERLMMLGFRVKGSVTTTKKASRLQEAGIDAYAVDITEGGVKGAPQGFLKNVDALYIMIPPGLRRDSGADYVLKMNYFLEEVKQAAVKKVIFISSTSVYSDTQGVVTERDVPMPDTEAGRQLFQAEQLFFNAPSFKTTIVRFGGLFGGSRQPVRYLAGRTGLNGGNAPVNLIHQNDCISILTGIVLKDIENAIINAVHPDHPLKREYYTRKALEFSLEPPQFEETTTTPEGKQIDSVNIDLLDGFTFKESL